jgi:hypothetical protein
VGNKESREQYGASGRPDLEQEVEKASRILEKKIAEKEKRFLEGNLPNLRVVTEWLGNDETLERSRLNEQYGMFCKVLHVLDILMYPGTLSSLDHLNRIVKLKKEVDRSIRDSEARAEEINKKLSCHDEPKS